jgi:acyl-coenzyme A synthetase/AMP-(fatty) acid ligase
MGWGRVQLRPLIPTVKTFIVMTDSRHMPPVNPGEPLLCYEDWIAPFASQLPFKWEVADENMACGLCYTSGTTGRPKVGQLDVRKPNVPFVDLYRIGEGALAL